ncbi:MAG: SMC family ATPase [Chloroflexota bacterium]|nr:SMC family ATPase [Chloroflexota bacterium]
MIPIRLCVTNFMCYGDDVPPLDFRSFHVACLCGDNGNGKSALLDAMTWALWGKARAKSDDELVHLGKADMSVEFEFALGGEHYRVIRKRTRPRPKRAGQPLLDFQIGGDGGFRSIAGNSIRETEQRIVEILRMDYDTFTNSAYLLQGHADEFTKKPPSQRKEVLASVLDLSRYDDLEDLARKRARVSQDREMVLASEVKAIDDELLHRDEYQGQLREIRDVLDELDRERKGAEDRVHVLVARKSELDAGRQQRDDADRRIRQAREAVASFEAQVKDRRQRVERHEKLLAAYDGEVGRIETRLAELVKTGEDLAGKRDLLQHTSNRLHFLQTTSAGLEGEGKELKEKIDMLAQEEARCPLCGTELGVDGRHRILASYQSQIEEKREAYKANEAEARSLEKKLAALQREVAQLERVEREGRAECDRKKDSLDRERGEAEDSLPGEREALKQGEEALERWQAALDEDSIRRASLESELAGLAEVESRLAEARRAQEDIASRHAAASSTLGRVQEKVQRCVTLERSRQDKRAELERILRDREVYEDLATAFGKRGIQALIIETALPEIEEEANRLLARMTDNRMHVKMESQRAYKSRRDEAIETLDISISDELGMRRYELYSGGEAFRIDFALRIALSRLLARRAGAPLSTLIIDEGFGTQDASGREKLVEAINSIQDDFDKILVVTHIEELKDAFPTRIEVTKTGDGSTIEVG